MEVVSSDETKTPADKEEPFRIGISYVSAQLPRREDCERERCAQDEILADLAKEIEALTETSTGQWRRTAHCCQGHWRKRFG